MRLLHTSDWHVGKLIRGRSRADEHRAVLAEIAGVAADETVDAILVAGDLFETAAPGPESEQIVYRSLLDLAEVAPVVVVAGNHDNPRRLEAVTPLLDLGRIHLLARVARPDQGGLVDIDVGGTALRVALLPFVSKRGIVRSDALMRDTGYELNQSYDERVRAMVASLCHGFDADSVNVVCGHLFAAGGTLGGGERSAHTIMDYSVGSLAFPPTAQYVALGHLHRAQDISGPTRIRYAGSPLQLDFGESAEAKSVSIVDLEPGLPAAVRKVELREGRRLRTLTGTLDELAGVRGTTGDDHLRIVVHEHRRAGLADEIRDWFEHAVDVIVRPPDEPDARPRARRSESATPSELFAQYLAERGVDDARLITAFDSLLDDLAVAGEGAGR